MLSLTNAEQLVHAFMTPSLDYCNGVMGYYPAHFINFSWSKTQKLQQSSYQNQEVWPY